MALDIPAGWGATALAAGAGVPAYDPGDALKKVESIQQLKAAADETDARAGLLRAQTPGVAAESILKGNAASADTQTTLGKMMANEIAVIDPGDPKASDRYNSIIDKYSNKGLESAAQWRDKYSPASANRLVTGYSAASPTDALAAVTGGGLPQGNAGPEQMQAYASQLAKMSPEDLKAHAAEIEQHKTALATVMQSADPATEWDKQAAAMGHPELVGKYSPLRAQQMYADIAPVDQALQSVMAQKGAGLTGAPAPKIQVVDGVAYQIDGSGNMTAITPKYEKVGPGETFGWTGAGGPQGPGGDQRGGNTPVATGPVYTHIAQAAAADNAPPAQIAYLQRLAQVESSGDPTQRNGSSQGLFQFHPSTFNKVNPGGDINSVEGQTQAAISLDNQNRTALQKAGVQPTDANAYIMHQQGPAGGLALLSAPQGASAVSVLAPAYGGNESTATTAIAGNIGMPYRTAAQKAAAQDAAKSMTAQQFTNLWQARWGASTPQATGPISQSDFHVIAGGGADDAKLSPDAVDYVAQQYVLTGQLPAMGMGATATLNRTAVINAASQIEKETGATGADAVTRHLTIKSTGSALTNNTKQYAAMTAAADAASKNAALMLSLAPKGGDPTGIPVLNRWVQAGRKAIAGDPDVTAFDSALSGYSEQFAKVQSGALGSAPATDSARAAAYDRLSKYAASGQLQSGVATMNKEMANDQAARRAEVDHLQAIIRNGGVDPASKAPTPSSLPVTAVPGLTPQQQATAGKYKGAQGPGGSSANPWVLRGDADAHADRLPIGAYYIGPDGHLRQKQAQTPRAQ